MNYKLFFFYFIKTLCFQNDRGNKLIISLSANKDNIKSLHQVVYSILDQNVSQVFYEILIILEIEINELIHISKELLYLFNEKKIKIITTRKLNLQTKLLFAINEYPKNPILIIGSNVLFPEGWLEMLINDHKLHPDEIISTSIQYYFGKNAIINEFSEGYKGYLFGTFNHISNMIFNFAIINTELGGTLYPPGIFKNKYFFDEKLFSKISSESDEFWQSCFIIIENKILRQSSKIP